MNKNSIFVTQPSLPPLNEFYEYLQKIWETKWLTNGGPYHEQLEKELCNFLNVPFISLFSNGTLALITALQALRITGEVITTPFSFVATTHSLWWNNIKPVFVDIEPQTCNIDPEKIEAAITPQTTAIMPVHVYGNPCNHKAILQIADNYNLRIIYDAAHAFGVKQNKVNICNWGDLSVLSFHATKVFNTFEGGAIICHDAKMKRHIDDLKNFGFRDETTVIAPGINAKMNEVQAAMGLLSLKYIPQAIEKRRNIFIYYQTLLQDTKGIKTLNISENVEYNYAYFPIFIDETQFGQSRDAVYEKLKKEQIFTRRYFYPLISNFSTYKSLPSANKKNLLQSNQIANKVLCLPIYPNLKFEDIKKISNILLYKDN